MLLTLPQTLQQMQGVLQIHASTVETSHIAFHLVEGCDNLCTGMLEDLVHLYLLSCLGDSQMC